MWKHTRVFLYLRNRNGDWNIFAATSHIIQEIEKKMWLPQNSSKAHIIAQERVGQ